MKKEKKLKNSLIMLPVMIVLVTVSIILIAANFSIQGYILRFTGKHIEDRFKILDAYYNETGYEGYYEQDSPYVLYVEHLILDNENQIIYPDEAYESEDSWKLITEIVKKYEKGGLFSSEKGKIRVNNKTYFYQTKQYTGEFDDFFIIKGREDAAKSYVVLAYTDISVIAGFLRFLNFVLLAQMILSAIAGLLIVFLINAKINLAFGKLKKYIEKAHRKEKLPQEVSFFYQEFNEVARALFQMSQMVEEAEKKQESFFQNASHELRTPLMSIQGYAEGIMLDAVEDEKTAAEIILKNSEKMSSLVDEILFLSKMDMNKLQDSPHPFDVREVLSLCILQTKEEAEIKGISVVSELGEDELPAYGDDKLLERAVMNILSNALRYARTKIGVLCGHTSKRIIIKIADDGHGISEEDKPHIFERFYKGKGGNTGIGLAITAEVIKKMGGSIQIHSEDGLTEFTLIIPLRK